MLIEKNCLYRRNRKSNGQIYIEGATTFSAVDTLLRVAAAENDWTDIGRLSEDQKAGNAFYGSEERDMDIGTNKFRAAQIYSITMTKKRKNPLIKRW
jgi:hypothetical protein